MVAYAALAAALDGPAHRTLYPLVGWGHPMTGRRRWLVRVFSPFVLLGIGLCRLPIMVVGILILIMRA
jgi:hypothetical protein